MQNHADRGVRITNMSVRYRFPILTTELWPSRKQGLMVLQQICYTYHATYMYMANLEAADRKKILSVGNVVGLTGH